MSKKFALNKFGFVLQNRCCYKFRDTHRKAPALESLLNKVAGLKVIILLLLLLSLLLLLLLLLLYYYYYYYFIIIINIIIITTIIIIIILFPLN